MTLRLLPASPRALWGWFVEQLAFEALVAEFNERYPRVEVVSASLMPVDRDELLREQLANDAVYLPNLSRFGVTESDQSESQLLNLDKLAAREGWNDAFSDAARNDATVGGSLWALPVNIYRHNAMIYSPELLADVGITAAPTSLAELSSACEVVEDARKTCLALDGEDWSAAAWILDGVFPVEWISTEQIGGVLGRDFELMAHPGAASIYVRSIRGFAVTAGRKNALAAEAWLEVAASEKGQAAFNLSLTSIPARRLEDESAFGAYRQSAIETFADPGTERIADWPTTAPNPDIASEVAEVLEAFVEDGNVEVASTWFVENYSRLQP